MPKPAYYRPESPGIGHNSETGSLVTASSSGESCEPDFLDLTQEPPAAALRRNCRGRLDRRHPRSYPELRLSHGLAAWRVKADCDTLPGLTNQHADPSASRFCPARAGENRYVIAAISTGKLTNRTRTGWVTRRE